VNDLVVTGGKLALICVIAALSLGVVNAITEPEIERVKQRQLEEALAYVSLGGELGDPVEVGERTVREYYPLDVDRNGEYDGYVVSLIGIGYGGDMKLLAAYGESGEVRAVSLLDNAETPGLGKEAERPSYMEKFVGTGGDTPVPTSKQMLSQAQADAISGASLTFMGIGDALEAGSQFVKRLGGGS